MLSQPRTNLKWRPYRAMKMDTWEVMNGFGTYQYVSRSMKEAKSSLNDDGLPLKFW